MSGERWDRLKGGKEGEFSVAVFEDCTASFHLVEWKGMEMFEMFPREREEKLFRWDRRHRARAQLF